MSYNQDQIVRSLSLKPVTIPPPVLSAHHYRHVNI